MYFKRLEMFGFKSFAERTRLDFEPGITAVVGPNGCGKSNVLDSVKWVLGEQSAKSLRGACMEDVIFNGSDIKEQLGYAEVSLTLSNESKFLPIEYDEVTITRRLYRSGESEYCINKNPVRLRDIEELLMGSGIGTSAYSVIEQGKIDQVVSADPETRRVVFEEASGITKYKAKKREAIRKLEYTEQNLLRVGDIIKEVERQINSIERQAKKAKKYQELFDRLKELDTKLAAFRFNGLREKQEGILAENDGIKAAESGLAAKIGEIAGRVEKLKSDKSQLDSRIMQYRADHANTGTALDRSRDRIILNRERLQELHKYGSEQTSELEVFMKRIEGLSQTIGEITNQLVAISEGIKSKESRLVLCEHELAALKSGMERENESIKANKLCSVDVISVQSRLRNELAKVTSDLSNVCARLRRLEVEKANILTEAGSIVNSLSEARSSVNETMSRIETLEKERIALQNSIRNERESSGVLEKKIDQMKNYILSLHSRLGLLQDLIKRNEGFTGGTQALLNGLSGGTFKPEGFCRPLADLLEPKIGYEAMCEAALNGNMQTVVVDDWHTAFDALEFLQTNGLGKASFTKNEMLDFNLDEIKVEDPLVLGKAIDFLKFDQQHRPLFRHLLNGVFLVRDLHDGILVLKGLPVEVCGRVRLVTKAGDVIVDGKITGGSETQDFTTSIIGRQMRLREIESHIQHEETELLKLKQELQVKVEIAEGLEAKAKQVEDALRSDEIELAQKMSREENLTKDEKRIQEEIDLVTLEMEESLANQEDMRGREGELKAEFEQKRTEEATLQTMIMDSQAFIEEGARKREELLVAIAHIQTEVASLKSQEDENLKRAQTQKYYCDEQARILQEKQASIAKTVERQAELREEIAKLEAEVGQLAQRHDIVGKELEVLDGESARYMEAIGEEESGLVREREGHDRIKDRMHSLQMELTQLSFQMESLRTKIDQIYKVDIREVAPEFGESHDLEAMANEVNELSQTVQRMGPVNLVAIDEHKELEERFTFLKRQQEDLVSAKDQLHAAIKKINQTTKDLFLETFTKIQAEFRNYFRFLFGGGKADIVLLDESDVLESGIEIIVRPPGKKLQTISLLSGGEKALTATALLFAIFKTKPSPFCILDEIDAPLDESNIGRFCKALQEFAKASQFIIITHNKKTMSVSDVMYGITMESSGVSKVISVKLTDMNDKEKEEIVAVA